MLLVAVIVVVVCLLVAGAIYAIASSSSDPKAAEKKAAEQNLVKKASGCERTGPIALSCNAGQKITAGNIKYGRWDNTICPHPSINASTAPKFKTYPLPTAAVGQNAYSLSSDINIAVNDDPYPYVYKQYEIDYTCTPSA